jgi:hypothetical protein
MMVWGSASVGELLLALFGLAGLIWVLPGLRREWRTYRWARLCENKRLGVIARARVRKYVSRVTVCAGAIGIGALAASAPGRWIGSGVGLEIARVLVILAAAAITYAAWADDRDLRKLERLKNEALLEILNRQKTERHLRGVDQAAG